MNNNTNNNESAAWWNNPKLLIVIGIAFVVINQIPVLSEVDTLAVAGLILKQIFKLKDEGRLNG